MSSFALGVAALVVSICTAVVALVGAIFNRRSSGEANKTDKFEAITAALEKRIEALERDLAKVEQRLEAEQRGHIQTRGQFAVATKYIRDLRAWIDGGRQGVPPPVPVSLAEWV